MFIKNIFRFQKVVFQKDFIRVNHLEVNDFLILRRDGNEVWNPKNRPRHFDRETCSALNCRGRFLRFHTSFVSL